MNDDKKKDSRAPEFPGQNPPVNKPGGDKPFPAGSSIEETNSDADIEGKQTMSGD